MDTSPHIGGAADSQKDRGVRQRKSLVFLFVIPDSSDMQQNESVTARRNAHYRRKTCPPALRRNRSSMSVFFGTFLKYQVCQAGILPLQVFTTGGAYSHRYRYFYRFERDVLRRRSRPVDIVP